jgi:hypothetical protein
MTFCGFHPRRFALETCQHCRIAICEECKNILKGRSYCPNCALKIIPGVSLVPFRNPYKAAILSAIIPGLGQVYNGQLARGLKILIFCWLLIPWIYGIRDAYQTAVLINQRRIATAPSTQDFTTFLIVGVTLFFALIQTIRYHQSDEFMGGLVQKDLRMLEGAIGRYQKDHQSLPQNFSQLYFAQPPYVEEILCDAERHGYYYSCEFTARAYILTATPRSQNRAKALPVYTLRTGGQLDSQIF